jgi:hypothetical protein
MKSGQVKEKVFLENSNGERDDYAFLPTPIELWDTSQTRLTLLFDPGRVKKQVGPNQALGAPLKANQRYRLVVAKGMMAATGIATNQDHILEVKVGPAERRRLVMNKWKIVTPLAGSQSPIKIHFDRVIDPSNTLRNLHIEFPDSTKITGFAKIVGQTWEFTPDAFWHAGEYRIVAARSLEDIAGNRLNTAFDSIAGTSKSDPEFAIRRVTIPTAKQSAN